MSEFDESEWDEDDLEEMYEYGEDELAPEDVFKMVTINRKRGKLVKAKLQDEDGDTIELARRGNGVNPFHARTETGEFVTGVIDGSITGEPTAHDMLTGSTANGRAYTDSEDHTFTCTCTV